MTDDRFLRACLRAAFHVAWTAAECFPRARFLCVAVALRLNAALALRESLDPLRRHAPPPGVDPRPN
jgi:hypothetical protein